MDPLKLSKNEMKKIFGGQGNTSTCSASCADGTTVSITCEGSCTSTPGVGVGCTGGKKEWCPGKDPSAMR